MVKLDQKQVFSTLFILLACVIYAGNISFVLPSSMSPDLIAVSLVIDLAVWVPLLYYALLARKGYGPKSLLKVLFTIGLLTSVFLMPEQSMLEPIRFWYPFVMLSGAAIVAGVAVYRFSRAFCRSQSLSGEKRIAFLSQSTVGKGWFADILQAEWTGIYYGIFGWRLNTQTNDTTRFGYVDKNGAVSLLIFMSLFQIPSLFFTHIIFHNISPGLAMFMTVAHIYTLFFGLSQANAMRHRPMELTSEGVQVRCGLLFDSCIQYSDIAKIEHFRPGLTGEKDKNALTVSLFGNDNICLILKRKVRIPVIASWGKSVDKIYLGVDAPHALVRQINQRIKHVV